MVPSISEVLQLPAVRRGGPTVLAGVEHLGRAVHWVHIAEIVDVARLLRGGELVLTTGIALPEHGRGLQTYVQGLRERGAVGLVVELGQRWAATLPVSLVETCQEHGLPLISLHHEVRYAEVTQAIGERILNARVYELQAVEQVHESFTRLTVAGASPAEILSEVNHLSGCPVVLESLQHQVLGYDAGATPAIDLLADWEERSRSVHSPSRTFFDDRNGWLVTIVGARGDDWGRLIVQTTDSPSRRLVVLAEQAVAALAIHRLHTRDRDNIERQADSALLAALSTGEVTEELVLRAAATGVQLTRHQLLGVAIRPVLSMAEASDAAPVLRKVAAVAASAARDCAVSALVAPAGDDVQMLLSLSRRRSMTKAVERIAAEVRRHAAILIAAGGVVDDPSAAPRSLLEAAQVLSAIRGDDHDRGVHRLVDVHVRGLIHLLRDDDRLRLFAERELMPLLEHDLDAHSNGTGLLDTVRAILEHPSSKAAAAAALHVSRPVLYDRVAKIERLLGARLTDGETRTSLHMALLVRDSLSERG